MTSRLLIIPCSLLLIATSMAASVADFHAWAPRPPMGWNSWDGFATTVTEAQTRAQADVMKAKLASHGWNLIVVDIQWYEPKATGFDYRKGAKLGTDEYGRLVPATNKFPSAANGQGFKPLADYIHSLGLKFGLHLMRGIPRQAVVAKTPIKGTPHTAADIVDTNHICEWNGDMYGVDMAKSGAQEYYDSVFELLASWGLDFVKVDDLSRPYHQAEIEAIRKAIDRTGRPMVFSTSPGATPLSAGEHVSTHANMWRISDDFWDKWPLLLEQFDRLRDWAPDCGPGHFPDADMLPIGVLQMGKTKTHFKPDEQVTLLTLWSIGRSPLIVGADLTKLDDFTLALITNDEVLAVDQNSTHNREFFRRDGFYGWVADAPGSTAKYLAIFNARDVSAGSTENALPVAVKLSELGILSGCEVRNLWTHEELGRFTNEFAPRIHFHGAGLYRLSPAQPAAATADARVTEDFDANWLFCKSDFAAAMMPQFDDSGWRTLKVPHDWSIEGPFSAEYGSGNGFAPGGIGWYRKHFQPDAAQTNKLVAIEFDGVYDNSEVWINGQFVGARPFGFASFQYDLTPYLKWGADNVVSVRVDHSRFADSRFYTGSGIYRNVRLCLTDKLRIAHWGTHVTTPKIKSDSARVRVATTIENIFADRRSFSLQTEIVAPDGKIVASLTAAKSAAGNSVQTLAQELRISRPQLWSLESPWLYTIKSRVKSGETVVDETETPFGIRTATFEVNQGFFLNGVSTKLKGVCLHHDAGSLGAAVPDQVLGRRLRLLKEIGVNAIRTSHNPPDPALLNLCDQMGFLVMDEAFDEFTPSKNKWVGGLNAGAPSHFGYGEMFAQWSVRDLQDLVHRDRNHPSVILWSIGNEIDYANDPFSDPVLGAGYRPENPPAQDLLKCAAPLAAAVKSLDRTRPVTAALANLAMSDAVGLPELLDAAGYNYQEARYAADHKQFPQRIIYGSENGHEYGAWLAVQTNNYIAGQFLWTGIDYLGEARAWPDRASGAGLLDLCGFKKPLGWYRQSLWSDQPMVYLCASTNGAGGGNDHGGRRGFDGVESWNWPADSTVNVLCFANCPEVALLLNGRVIGTKKRSEAVNGLWKWQIPFEPGTLKAVGRANGQAVCSYVLKTAGSPARLEVSPDATQLRADGRDVCHVEFKIVDKNGVRVPDADMEVKFDVTGPAKIIGLGNGDLRNSENCQGDTHRAFQGRGLAILQTMGTSGRITLQTSAPGLESATVTFLSR